MTGATVAGLDDGRGASPAGGFGASPAGVEARIARILSTGTRVAIALLVVGSGLLLAAGRSPLETGWPALDLAALPADLLALRPEGFLWLGLLVTLATPLLRVLAATVGFAGTGDRRMVGLGIAVLVVIGLAVAAGSLRG